MVNDIERLRATLGDQGLEWLVSRIKRKLENGRAAVGIVTLKSPTSVQRAAVDGLFGRRPTTGDTLTVDLSKLEEVIRNGQLAESLSDAVEALTGPIVNEKQKRLKNDAEWEKLISDARHEADSNANIVAYVDGLGSSGLLRRMSHQRIDVARKLLFDVLAISMKLPAAGVPLAELAAEVAGDSHALDMGNPLGTLGVRLAAALGGVESWETAQERRDAWSSVGVLCDELSASVLVVNLRADTTSLTGRTLQLHADAGEPYRLTLRQLLRNPARFDVGTQAKVVYVCENPTVVAATADRLGRSSAALVCTEGQPNTAVQVLFKQLVGSGATLAYHGDFDWGGILIGNLMKRRFSASPWHFSADAYLAAEGGSTLAGSPVEATWDCRLTQAMRERGQAVYEEQVLGDLLKEIAL